MENFDLGDICGIVEHLREQSEMLDGMGAMLLILANHSEDIPEAPLMEDTWAYVLHDLADKTWKMKKKLTALENTLYKQLRASNPQTSADLREGGKQN